jgi:hypothetical protein
MERVLSGHIVRSFFMAKPKRSNRIQAFRKPTNVLKAIQLKAINIRKLLKKNEKAFGKKAWRNMDDALELAASIEVLASRAINSEAADAIVMVELLELMLSDLDHKLTCILTS